MSDDARDRLVMLSRRWDVAVGTTWETETSVLAFGSRRGRPVVLKVVRREGDEWDSGEILQAFQGHGVVRIYEFVAGGMLLERAMPGESLVPLATSGRDAEATAILAKVIKQMSPTSASSQCPTVHDWAKAFTGYLQSGDEQISRDLVQDAHGAYMELENSQREVRLLHGDLHHYNVLRDARRGWLAIDPKGVVAEVEYECGAVLRNPVEDPDLFTSLGVVENRVEILARTLGASAHRILRWAYTQAVLSAIWDIEDGEACPHGAITLAARLRRMLS
ncbi:MAG: hypothetical protein A3G21_12445 [Acidobacteria bacterium RIFCSPLOWO2_12_FULL_66_21]|nr:MAG: hypothetical protein A3G21_12445 [Acidobacteria bacterium RIFCSPLOWO2_12_FULL_66_21]